MKTKSTEPKPGSQPAETRQRSLLPKKVADICAKLGMDLADSPLLREGMTPEQFLDRLIEKERYIDALTFMSCALPRREAVWWACVCTRQCAGEDAPAEDAGALDAAVRWVREPNDENRRATMSAAEATEFATPGGLTALGAFFSGGSMAPPDLPPAPPEEHLTARFVSQAVTLAAVMKEPEKAQAKYRRFLETGLDVAHRQLHWDQKPVPS